MNKEILEREKPIWLGIVQAAERILPQLRNMWKKHRDIPKFMFSWPSEHLRTSDGKTEITHLVRFEVPKDMTISEAALVCTKHTKPYAMLAVEKKDGFLIVLLESFHGTRCWKFPIARHGDVEVLEKEIASEDTESFGILWRRSVGQS